MIRLGLPLGLDGGTKEFKPLAGIKQKLCSAIVAVFSSPKNTKKNIKR